MGDATTRRRAKHINKKSREKLNPLTRAIDPGETIYLPPTLRAFATEVPHHSQPPCLDLQSAFNRSYSPPAVQLIARHGGRAHEIPSPQSLLRPSPSTPSQP